MVKSASVTSFSEPGTAITYSYTVTNSGNVTLSSVNVTDPMTGLSAVTCPAGPLAPASSETCRANYTTTEADVNAGKIKNTGTASGTSPSGKVVTAEDSLTIPFTPPSCYVGPWPQAVTGYPALPSESAKPTGYFIGVVNNVWTLYSHSKTVTGAMYTGTITTTGTFSNVIGLRLDNPSNDYLKVSKGMNKITFHFRTGRFVDGLRFESSCGSQVVFNLEVNGQTAPLKSVHLGNPTTKATSTPQTFVRKS
jgi:uncharacterized repeat protein (TIGR01451 family)